MTFAQTAKLDIGTLEWATQTDGKLTGREKVSLLAPILQTTVRYMVGRLRLLLGMYSSRAPRLDIDTLTFPDTTLAREAERACREKLSSSIINHSYRTYIFALALSMLDEVKVDRELLYVTSLLHDIAIETPTPNRCFAIVGSEQVFKIAQAAQVKGAVATQLAEAVSMHNTPGVGYGHGPLAPLTAAGALVDLIGLRLWDVNRTVTKSVMRRYPRDNFKSYLTQCWKQEVSAVPNGRAALVEHVSLFTLFVRLAPFAD